MRDYVARGHVQLEFAKVDATVALRVGGIDDAVGWNFA